MRKTEIKLGGGGVSGQALNTWNGDEKSEVASGSSETKKVFRTLHVERCSHFVGRILLRRCSLLIFCVVFYLF